MNKSRGFTLIELLIVVAIIAILAAIAIPNFLAAQVRSKVSRVTADMATLATGLESYYVDNNEYPLGQRADMSLVPHDIRLSPLTTPVAYVSSLPKDCFQQSRRAWFGDAQTMANTQQAQFDYWNWSKTNPDFAATPRYHEIQGGPMTWQLLSVGPNGVFDMDAQWRNVNGSDIVYFTASGIYDPTNGTVSYGDIWRVGASR